MAKQISKFLGDNALNGFIQMLQNGEHFDQIDGIGEIINDNIYKWYKSKTTLKEFNTLISVLKIEDDVNSITTSNITGKTFVITGSVEQFKNRDELKAYIESLGGKTSGSVSAKTDYLINNDVSSNSGKNKKAKELGVPIISEDDFLKMTK